MAFYDISVVSTETHDHVTAKLPKAWGYWALADYGAGHDLPEVEALVQYALTQCGADISNATLVEVCHDEVFVEPFGPEGELTELVEYRFVNFIDYDLRPGYDPDDEDTWHEDLLDDDAEEADEIEE